jgi:hypothetical protein
MTPWAGPGKVRAFSDWVSELFRRESGQVLI